MAELKSTTIRDFGGGWNTSDSDMSLSSQFQPISDNVVRGLDGSIGPRMGFMLFADFKTGNEVSHTGVTISVETFDGRPFLTIEFPFTHGMSNGHHITISGVNADINGIPKEAINGTHGVLVDDTTTVSFYVTVAATSDGTLPVVMNVLLDSHLLGGNIIHKQYFSRRMVVFTDIGEIGTIDNTGTCARIWGVAEAELLSAGLIPTRRCRHWSSGRFKSTMIACNGYDRDKPIQIKENFTVEFLSDKSSLSNAAVPRADFVVCLQKYVVFIRTEYGAPFVEMSAKGTDGTFTREMNPDDAVELDLSIVTDSVEPVLLGACQLRDKLYTAFYDRGMIGTLGIYNSDDEHEPDFSDTISEHGTVSHRTLVSLGNDIFMCDYAGVPSVTISRQSGIHVPIRVSELIAPTIQKHLSRLSEDTLRQKSFAIYDKNSRSYMLFLPIYDEVTQHCPIDPIQVNAELNKNNYAYLRLPNHGLFEDSLVTIAGASGFGGLDAGDINGTRRIVSVVNPDAVIVEFGSSPLNADATYGGGDSMTVTPINNETIGYIFEYNHEFKIRRWTRFRHWNFDCAAASQRGKVFLSKGLRVYRMGDSEIPIHADFVGEYDHRTWEHNTTYDVGIRVLDADGIVYQAAVAHESPSSGTFAEYRAAHLDDWIVYRGEPIRWAAETPWSDLKVRDRNKINVYVGLESEGTGQFTLSAFTNSIRRNPESNELMPKRSLSFMAGDSGGFGIQTFSGWGGGRRTRDEKLWPFALRGKLIRWRYSGETREPVKIVSHTMYYKIGNIR